MGGEPGDPVDAAIAQPAAPPVTEPEPFNTEKLNRVPTATNYVFDAVLDKAISLRRSFSPDRPLPLTPNV